MAKHFNYFDDWQSTVLECPVCQWQGTVEQGSMEYCNELFDSSCPVCDIFTAPTLAIVSYPTNEQMEANFDKLNDADRQGFLARKAFLAKAEKECLKSPSELPELEGERLELAWDLEEVDSERVTVIRFGDIEVWREPAFYEGYERFEEMLQLLKAGYGKRLMDVVPTQWSETYLYGDRLSAPEKVEEARRGLQGPHDEAEGQASENVSYEGIRRNYDIIGDIHGCSDTLETLLAKLDYKVEDGVYRHATRKVIFLGDFIDRGPKQREVVKIVRRMVEAGTALAVMGNHEFNAIAYYTSEKDSGDFLRKHTAKNRGQHQAFLDVYESRPDEYADTINWFKSLPLWLDFSDLKVIHACWDRQAINALRDFQNGSSHLGDALLEVASKKGTWQYKAVETILKGKEISLRGEASFKDKDGHVRHEIRVRWWDHGATTYKDAFMGPESARTHIPEDEIHGDHLVEYSHDGPPVFLGHYWMEGRPEPLAINIACIDYSVAKEGGKLTAYRWDGEQQINRDHFVWVDRQEA